jgi:hypothetical protein
VETITQSNLRGWGKPGLANAQNPAKSPILQLQGERRFG